LGEKEKGDALLLLVTDLRKKSEEKGKKGKR